MPASRVVVILLLSVQACGPTCLELSTVQPVVEKPWPLTSVHTNRNGEVEENVVLGTLSPGRYSLRESWQTKGIPGYVTSVGGKPGYLFLDEGVNFCKEK